MDQRTREAYHANATNLCQRHRRAVPTNLYRLILQHFHQGQPTADIGCGSGRDVAWLVQQGFPAIGYDASPAMLREARNAYPHIDVREDCLPQLASIPDTAYVNILCNATLMHVPRASLPASVQHVARITQAGGRMLISYRRSTAATEREHDGRLFTTIEPLGLATLLEQAGLCVYATEQQADTERPGLWWEVCLAERSHMTCQER